MTVTIDMTAFHGAFFDEADEHVATMEATLLELETMPADDELLNRVFRAAHSVKGGSGTFGFERITHLTHAFEALLDRLREKAISLTPDVSTLLLRGVDVLRGLVLVTRAGGEEPSGIDELRAELLAAAALDAPAAPSPEVAPTPETSATTTTTRIARIRFVPGADLFRTGMDTLLLLRDLAEMGEVCGVEVDASGLPALDDFDAETSYLGWTVSLSTSRTEAELRDVFAFVEDTSIVEMHVEAEPPPQGAPEAAETPRAEAAPERAPSVEKAAGATLRVSTDKLDRLINLVGELVIAQSMVAAAVGDITPDGQRRLSEAVIELERNTRDLQESVMSVRVVPVGNVFQRFTRLVRDVAATLGKKIVLDVQGEDTEIDRSLIERITDPLTHLVRNAVDHGIETPEERRLAGKPEEGRVTLRALHEGGNVVIEVIDDGRGLQTERIRQKAIAAGLLDPAATPSEDELHDMIFLPGFSTASQVTDVSGRGVGMDVVKRNILALKGSIAFTSRVGKGSSMRLRLPLTTAIMDGLSLRVGRHTFVAPLVSILESFRPTRQQLQSVMHRGEMVSVRGQPVPLIRLHQVLDVECDDTDATRSLVCVVEAGNRRAALLVDELLGQAQVVVKSLETNYRKVDDVMGATILGDGRVALILDIPSLVERAIGVARERETTDVGARHAA